MTILAEAVFARIAVLSVAQHCNCYSTVGNAKLKLWKC